MGLYILMGALAAFGLFCALWAIFGRFFGGRPQFVTLCFCDDPHAVLCAVARWKWLRGMGLTDGKLLLVNRGMNNRELQNLSLLNTDIEFCLLSELTATLELERNERG